MEGAIVGEFISLDGYDLALLLIGMAALGAAILPRIASEYPISFPIIYLAVGIAVFALPIDRVSVSPLEHGEIAERLTELGVIIALMGVGLKIDRPFGWRDWPETWRLLAITMPVTIALAALLGWWAVGLAPATAMLLGAVVAPTDPVLAADVQVGGPQASQERDAVRFSLTSEAGLNDGLAFPFTNAAIAMVVAGAAPGGWVLEWFTVAVVYKIVAGVVIGWLAGKLLATVAFEAFPGETKLAQTTEGLVAIAGTLLIYGLTEVLQGYGFIAVFVGAVAIRAYEREHEYHDVLHDFADQSERFVMAVIVLLLGGAIVDGLFAPLTWTMAAVAVVLVFGVRPLAGLLGMLGFDTSLREKATISFFGIRGIGSLYYLAHGLEEASFDQVEETWALVGFTVVLSIVVHGLAATPVMERLEQWRDGREA